MQQSKCREGEKQERNEGGINDVTLPSPLIFVSKRPQNEIFLKKSNFNKKDFKRRVQKQPWVISSVLPLLVSKIASIGGRQNML